MCTTILTTDLQSLHLLWIDLKELQVPRGVMILMPCTYVSVFACLIHFQELQVISNLDFCYSLIDHYTYYWKREDLDFFFFSICHFKRFQYDVQKPKRLEKNYLGDTVEAIDEVSLSKSIFKSGGFFEPKVAFIFPSPTSPSPRSWADSRRNWGLLGLSTNGGELPEDSLLDLKKKKKIVLQRHEKCFKKYIQ